MKRFAILSKLLMLLVAQFLLPGAAGAQSASAWESTAQAKLRLVSAVTGSAALQSVPLGLQFILSPGWKTYWRSPGDAGFPTNGAAINNRWLNFAPRVGFAWDVSGDGRTSVRASFGI